ncbi:MAG: DUF3592 domain-containing protein [Hyphomicrobiaceae bacterium]|nr:DUF3592 domain-containing protein [Hyphomicrobiaceae bacterium]
MLNKILARVGSSTLFNQEKFDEAGEKHPLSTHYKHVVLAVFLLGLLGVSMMALNYPKYSTARSLLARGVSTTAIVDTVDVKKLTGRGEKFITTVGYRFKVAGDTIHGKSTKNSVQPESVSKGDVIEVLYDPSQPIINGWRAALYREMAGVFGVLGAAALLLPYLGLSAYRYVRWLRRRRTLQPAR